MVHGMVEKAKQLEETPETCEEIESDRVSSIGEEAIVSRFEGADTHHWELLDEYVIPEQVKINMEIMKKSLWQEVIQAPSQT